MQELMSFHDVDIQWGNHDISWMGAAAGNLACICNVLRIAISYNSFDVLEDGYGINCARFPCLRRGYIRMIRASVLCPGSWMKIFTTQWIPDWLPGCTKESLSFSSRWKEL